MKEALLKTSYAPTKNSYEKLLRKAPTRSYYEKLLIKTAMNGVEPADWLPQKTGRENLKRLQKENSSGWMSNNNSLG